MPKHSRDALANMAFQNMTKGQRLSASRYGLIPPVRSDSERQMRHRYGMLPEEYDALFARQGGACAICCKTWKRRLYIDHNHATGEVRGLLCPGCNTLLGTLETKSPALVQAALHYIGRLC